MIIKGGFTNFGQQIGVLMLDTRFPRAPGDIGNAVSFDFPVRYKVVHGAYFSRVVADTPDDALVQPFIDAARELEAEGVRAITTSCGFLAPFQRVLAGAVGIPVFTSSLLQAPLIHRMLPPGKTIGVFTVQKRSLNERHFSGAGWSSNEIPVFIQGLPEDAVFCRTIAENRPEMDTEILRREMLTMTRAFLRDCPNPGAILLECTNMCPFSADIAEEARLPVYDVNSLIRYNQSALVPRRYA